MEGLPVRHVPFARGLAVCAFAVLAARPAAADIINELEVGGTASNNSVATAESIQAGFSLGVPGSAYSLPGNFSSVTVNGLGGGVQSDSPPSFTTDVDFYRFSTTGGRAYFDIDNTPFTFDAVLSLFNSSGTLIALNDDSSPADPGSESSLDPFLGVVTLPGGTYYLAVSQFNNFPATPTFAVASLTRPDGAPGGAAVIGQPGNSAFVEDGVQPVTPSPYTLIVTVENAGGPPPSAAVPAPPAVVLGLVGAMALGLRRTVRRRVA
jgi:hypothetical protein